MGTAGEGLDGGGPSGTAPNAPTGPGPEGGPPTPKTVGQKVCIGVALLLLLGGAAGAVLVWFLPRPAAPPRIEMTTIPLLIRSATNVRVLLKAGAQRLLIGAASDAKWAATGPGQRWEVPTAQGAWQVTCIGDRLAVDGEALPGRSAAFIPEDGVFQLDGGAYRGRLLVEVSEAGKLSAVEEVALEDYLRSVVPSEMPPNWPAAALMAQAVAARTFAVHRLSPQGHARPYLTHSDMAYGGVSAEIAATDRAVALTAGRVLTYQGATFPSYFHSCCGGATSSPQLVWGDPTPPPLQGVPCAWCEASPDWRWTAHLALSKVAAARLSARGIGRVESVVPTDPDPAGRAHGLLVNGAREMLADEFRRTVGSRSLKSTAFTVSREGGELRFAGRGWGHGVGLCQWGARGLALAGHTWREILAYYYPGGEIASIQPDM